MRIWRALGTGPAAAEPGVATFCRTIYNVTALSNGGKPPAACGRLNAFALRISMNAGADTLGCGAEALRCAGEPPATDGWARPMRSAHQTAGWAHMRNWAWAGL